MKEITHTANEEINYIQGQINGLRGTEIEKYKFILVQRTSLFTIMRQGTLFQR